MTNNSIFLGNLQRRINDITILITQADRSSNSKIKSCYYKSSIFLSCTIVEALLYKIVKDDVDNKGGVFFTEKDFKHPQKITHSSEDLYVCVKKEKQIGVDSGTKFQDLIYYAYHQGLFGNNERKKLESIRKKRNKLHIQSLLGNDVGYNKKELRKITEAFNLLIPKI